MSDYFLACMSGWRRVLCVLDNFTPHHPVPDPDDDDGDLPSLVAYFPFSIVCWLHDWAGNTASLPEVED
jgi:hypothetical protein